MRFWSSGVYGPRRGQCRPSMSSERIWKALNWSFQDMSSVWGSRSWSPNQYWTRCARMRRRATAVRMAASHHV